jgi:predicted acyl esterase
MLERSARSIRRSSPAASNLESELESIAVIDRKEMVTMRDGVPLATDV